MMQEGIVKNMFDKQKCLNKKPSQTILNQYRYKTNMYVTKFNVIQSKCNENKKNIFTRFLFKYLVFWIIRHYYVQ